MNRHRINDLVATELFGAYHQPRFSGDVVGNWIFPSGESIISEEMPDYAKDIEAAWMVVEHMRARGFRLLFTDDLMGSTKTAMFIGSGRGHSACAESDCEAICCAALGTLGVEL